MGLENLPELGHMGAWGIDKHYHSYHENYAHIADIEFKDGSRTVCYVYGKATHEEYKNYARGYKNVSSPVETEIVDVLFVRYFLRAGGYGHGEDEDCGERIEIGQIKSYKVLRKGPCAIKKSKKKKINIDNKDGKF